MYRGVRFGVSETIMKPEACQEVASRSRKQAEIYLQKGNAGRAFAHFLVALKLCPTWIIELTEEFTSALCSWGETLHRQKRYKDLFNCYEQALEVLPDNEEVLNNLGTHLYRWGHVSEACGYFRRAVACNPGFLPARRNFQGSCNLLVERWHFRMLNDTIRNDAYRAAITRRVSQQGTGLSVLDIGTGTGLLSLFAVEAGAEQVYACDCSPTMIEIASEVLRANGADAKVKLINKLSNDIVIPMDIPTRVSLVVTETVDAGLLGEGILQSLVHAWDHLLLPAETERQSTRVGRVVPEAAGVWVVPIECPHIARKYQYFDTDLTQLQENFSLSDQKHHSTSGLNLGKLRLTAKQDEPYDTEDLNAIPDGYRFLAAPYHAIHIKFNDQQDMSDWLNGKCVEHSLTCTESGQLDAVVAWFDLHLDDMIILSSAPNDIDDRDDVHRANCWDQAVFPLHSPIQVTSGQELNVCLSCQKGKLSVHIHNTSTSVNLGEVHTVSELQDAFYCSTISNVQNDFPLLKNILDSSHSNLENFSTNTEIQSESSESFTFRKFNEKTATSNIDIGMGSSKDISGYNISCKTDEEHQLKMDHNDCEVVFKDDDLSRTNLKGSHSFASANFIPTKQYRAVSSSVDFDSYEHDCGIVISQEAICFLNDEHWIEMLKNTAVVLNQKLRHKQMPSVLDISPFPVFGLHLLMRHPARLTCVMSSSEDDQVIRRVASLNSLDLKLINCMTEKQLLEILDVGTAQFDVIMLHVVEPSGELKETILSMIPPLRSSLTEDGIMLPQRISMIGQLLESDWLQNVSKVQNNSHTCGYDIGHFINTYQVSQHLDLNLSTLSGTVLSNPLQLVQISLDGSRSQTTHTVNVSVSHSGTANAVTYWFNVHLHEEVPAISTFHPTSHVSQAAILLQSHVPVCDGQVVKLLVRFDQGFIHLEPLHDHDTN